MNGTVTPAFRYDSGIVRYIELFESGEAHSDERADFVRAVAPAPCSVLDIGAGSGVTALALAAAGYAVTALEPDAGMFDLLLARLAVRDDLARLVSPVPRAAGMALAETFDVVTCFSVLHLLDGAAQAALVDSAAAHLRAGGYFVALLPVSCEARLPRAEAAVAERTFGSVRFEHFAALYRRLDGSWSTLWRFVASRRGEVLDEVGQSFVWRALPVAEWVALLATHGLTPERMWASSDGERFVEGASAALWLSARKAA